jgi:hypothetical protein
LIHFGPIASEPNALGIRRIWLVTKPLDDAPQLGGAPPVEHSTIVLSAYTVFMCFVFI